MTSQLPAPLARRFEAFLFDWDGTAVPDRKADASQLRRLIEELCSAGAEIGVVSGTHAGNVDGQLQARPSGPGSLHLLLNRGSEVFRVDGGGAGLAWRREATEAEDRALDAAAELAMARLKERGLETRLVSSRLNRRKIDLIPLPEWEDPPKAQITSLLEAVEARLAAHGIGGLTEAVRIAEEAAADVDLADSKVSTDAKHVEIGLTDKSDSARWFYRYLWSRGIDPSLVLVVGDEVGPLGGCSGSDSRLLIPEARSAVVLSVGAEPGGIPAGVLHQPGGPSIFLGLLEDQMRRRVDGDVPDVGADPAWELTIEGVDRELERTHDVLLTLADGSYGTSGVPLLRNGGAEPRVMVANTFIPDGSSTELVQAPVWNRLHARLSPDARVERRLDLHAGLLHQRLTSRGQTVRALEFMALDRPGTAVLRAAGLSPPQTRNLELAPPSESAAQVGWAVSSRDDLDPDTQRLDRVACYASSADVAEQMTRQAMEERFPFEVLLSQQRAAWARRWETADIEIEADKRLTQAVRFALFHVMASVADRGEAALGARGLSGPGYKGHVFWDSDVFVLPFLAATHPAAARAMLEYRVRRLPAAREAARRLEREGARFPWESAATGEDVTPTTVRDRRGQTVLIRTGLLEEHVVADIAWAASCYLDWTGDREFEEGPGAELLIGTARYWTSRVRLDEEGRAHIFGVIGPDEYHEAVDDDAYTNVMARWNLRTAARAAQRGLGDSSEAEASRWLELADSLVDGYNPDTGLYEQFAGFYRLEPLLIREVAQRRPIAADVLLGRERTEGAQVIKQASVLMLHHLVPGEVAPGSLQPNLAYYEPRTAHGSSLSPGIHASLFARAGLLDEAIRWLEVAARIDLDDITKSTASGLHVAAMGSVWQAIVMGFGGIRPRGGALEIAPRLPSRWGALKIRLLFRGQPVAIEMKGADVLVESPAPLSVISAGGERRHLPAGRSTLFLDR